MGRAENSSFKSLPIWTVKGETKMYHILICDDQPDIVNALEIYLAPEGYQLLKAYTGKEAVEVVKENEVHLILLDVMMPVMDGITAIGQIRKYSNAPIILLTAKSETEDKILGLNMGADDYITKPLFLQRCWQESAASCGGILCWEAARSRRGKAPCPLTELLWTTGPRPSRWTEEKCP